MEKVKLSSPWRWRTPPPTFSWPATIAASPAFSPSELNNCSRITPLLFPSLSTTTRSSSATQKSLISTSRFDAGYVILGRNDSSSNAPIRPIWSILWSKWQTLSANEISHLQRSIRPDLRYHIHPSVLSKSGDPPQSLPHHAYITLSFYLFPKGVRFLFERRPSLSIQISQQKCCSSNLHRAIHQSIQLRTLQLMVSD